MMDDGRWECVMVFGDFSGASSQQPVAKPEDAAISNRLHIKDMATHLSLSLSLEV